MSDNPQTIAKATSNRYAAIAAQALNAQASGCCESSCCGGAAPTEQQTITEAVRDRYAAIATEVLSGGGSGCCGGGCCGDTTRDGITSDLYLTTAAVGRIVLRMQ